MELALKEKLRGKSQNKENDTAMLLEWSVASCLFVGSETQYILKNRLTKREVKITGTFELSELNDDRLFNEAKGAKDTYELYLKGGRYMHNASKRCLINEHSIDFMVAHGLLKAPGYNEKSTEEFLRNYIASDTITEEEKRRFGGIFYNKGAVMKNINDYFSSSNRSDIKNVLLSLGRSAQNK